MDSSRNLLTERLEKIITDFDVGSMDYVKLDYCSILSGFTNSRCILINERNTLLGKMKGWAINTKYDRAVMKIIKKHKNDNNSGSLNSSLQKIFTQRSFTSFKFYSNVQFIGYVDCKERHKDPNTGKTFTETIEFDNFIPTPSLNLTDKEKMKYLDRMIELKNNNPFYKCVCEKGGLRWLNVFEVLGKLYILGSYCTIEFPLLVAKEYENRAQTYNLEKLKNDMCGTYNSINFAEDEEKLKLVQDEIDAINEEIRLYHEENRLYQEECKRQLANLKRKVVSGKLNSHSKDLTKEELKDVKIIERELEKEAKRIKLEEIKKIEKLKAEQKRLRRPINIFVKKHVTIIKTEKQNRVYLLEQLLKEHRTLEEKIEDIERQRKRKIILEEDKILEELRIKRQLLEAQQRTETTVDYRYKNKKESKYHKLHGPD